MKNPQKGEGNQTSFTNHFVNLLTGKERDCGHRHANQVDALECSLGEQRSGEAIITYRDDAQGRWQYLGEWALVDRQAS